VPNLFNVFNVADEYQRAGLPDEAERLYLSILDLIPDQPDTLDRLGVSRLRTGRVDEAIDLFRRAIDREASVADFHIHLGRAYETNGRRHEAATAFARAMVLLLNAGAPWREYGVLAEFVRRNAAETRRKANEILMSAPIAVDDVSRLSLAFHLTGDVDHYRSLAEGVLRSPPAPATLHRIYWGMTSRLFQGGAEIGDAAAFHRGPLAEVWRLFVEETARTFDVASALRPKRAVSEVRRVAIVTNQLLGEGHQPTVDALELTHRLRVESKLETLLVNTNAWAADDSGAFVPEVTFNIADAYDGDKIVRAGEVEARVISHIDRSFDRSRVIATLASIETFDPDVVVAFGGSNLYADLLVNTRPVVCLPTTSGYTHSLATLVLGYSSEDTTGDRSGDEAACFRPNAFGFSIREPEADATREALGLPRDGDLFMVVGNRLDVEVTDAFLDTMEALIAELPTARVVFAGRTTTLAKRLADRPHAERLHAVGHVRAVRALHRHAIAAVSPPRQGGGGSVATALAEGIPVVTTGGDTARVAGPEMTVADTTAMMETCVRLATDPAFRAELSAAARARFARIGDRSAAAARLVEYCREAAGTAVVDRF